MVKIEKALYDRAKDRAKEKGKTLQDYVNDVLLMNIEKDDFLKGYAPKLSLTGMTETSLYIQDAGKQRTAEIVIIDHELRCYLDESADCEHVHFALALPELGKLNMKRPRPKSAATG